MIRCLLRNSRLFTKITEQLYPQIKGRFEKQPSLKLLGEYFTVQNREALFNMVIESKITPVQSNQALETLLELCGTQNDEQLNLIVNVLKQKAINNSRAGKPAAAISEFQQAISTMLLMEHPDDLLLSQIYKFIADLYVQLNELKKAEKALKDSENLLKNLKFEEGDNKNILHSGLACIYTQLSMIYYREKKPIEAYEVLRQALAEWDLIPNKFLLEYELTCRVKCMLHILFKENTDAVSTARHYLKFLIESPEYVKAASKKRFMFPKLYYLNIICSFEKECQAEEREVIDLLRTLKGDRGEQKLQELMLMVGIKPDRYKL